MKWKILFCLLYYSISTNLIVSCAFGSSISKIVDKYCQLDYKGARIPGGNYAEIRKLMAWEEDQDEPGWDCFKIVSGYKVIDERLVNETAIVSVEYDILVTVWSNAEIDRKHYSDIVDFELVRINKGWKIRKYVTYPRISIETASILFEKWIKRWGAEGIENNGKTSKLRSLIRELEKIRE